MKKVELLHQGAAWRSESVSSHLKRAPGDNVGNLVCATGAAHARFRPHAPYTVKVDLNSADCTVMAASMVQIAVVLLRQGDGLKVRKDFV